MRQSHNGEWMTTNQVLVATQANHHIVRAVNRHSKRIKNCQVVENIAIQRQEDDIELNQQQTNAWTASLNSQVIDQMVGDNCDTASTTIPPESIATSTASVPIELTTASMMAPPLTTNLPSKLYQ